MSPRIGLPALASLLVVAAACCSGRMTQPSLPVASNEAGGAAVPPPAAAPVAAAWSAETPVGRIVAERPSTARILERAGIDYCCGGGTPLGEAVRARGGAVRLEVLLAELALVRESPAPADERVWTDAPLADLVRHIEATHHEYLREELPRLTAIVGKVKRVHGDNHPELAEVSTLWATIASELPPHLELEERRLFPAIEALERGGPAPDADVLPALALMMSQHENAGTALHRLRELTNGYAVPADACASYRQMLSGLAALETDLHTHVHLENNVLAPRVRALARG
jgi:regulator of cell morphogenesis and NO signaling